MDPEPTFATDAATAAYYEMRAREYDEWYLGEGRFAERSRPGWEDEVLRIARRLDEMPDARTLDVACGTGYLSRHLRGPVIGIDQSGAMVGIAKDRFAGGLAVVGDALHLPFAARTFDRVFTGHFYGHLGPREQSAFLAEASRVAGELLVVDSARRPGGVTEQWQERVLNDGSTHRVFKRYLTARQLADEIGGKPIFDGDWFVAALTTW